MVEIATPNSPAVKKLVALLGELIPDIGSALEVTIHLQPFEPIEVTVRRAVREQPDVLHDARVCDVTKRFRFYEVESSGK